MKRQPMPITNAKCKIAGTGNREGVSGDKSVCGNGAGHPAAIRAPPDSTIDFAGFEDTF